MKKYGGFIPGIRPGKRDGASTSTSVLTRLTFGGALYISAVCMLPAFMQQKFQVPFSFGGTGLLIVVGVALDTVQQIESHLITRNYEGFTGPKGPRIRGRARAGSARRCPIGRAQPDPARRAGCRQGHAGAAAGGALRHSADLDGRHAARRASRRHAARQEGRGVHEQGRSSCPTRSSSASSRSGCGKPTPRPASSSTAFRAPFRRREALDGVLQKLGRAQAPRHRRAGSRGDADRAARRAAVVPEGRRVVPREVHAAEEAAASATPAARR